MGYNTTLVCCTLIVAIFLGFVIWVQIKPRSEEPSITCIKAGGFWVNGWQPYCQNKDVKGKP